MTSRRAIRARSVRGQAAHRLSRTVGAVWAGERTTPIVIPGTCLSCGSHSALRFVQNPGLEK
jgi:hypothetical protein